MKLTQNQLNAILAGLRLIEQYVGEGCQARYDTDFIDSILTDGNPEQMSADDIDDLAQTLNLAAEIRIVLPEEKKKRRTRDSLLYLTAVGQPTSVVCNSSPYYKTGSLGYMTADDTGPESFCIGDLEKGDAAGLFVFSPWDVLNIDLSGMPQILIGRWGNRDMPDDWKFLYQDQL